MFVEIIGEPETGKSHFAQTFPNPFTFVLSNSKKTVGNVRMQHDDWKDRIFIVDRKEEEPYEKADFYDGRDVLDEVIHEFDTIIFDTGYDFRKLMADEWKKDTGNESVYPIRNWSDIKQDKIDPVLARASNHTHLVIIGQMFEKKDSNGRSTGGMERRGIKRTNYVCDLRFYLSIENCEREVYIAKNSYQDKVQRENDYLDNNHFDEVKKIVPEFVLDQEKYRQEISDLYGKK